MVTSSKTISTIPMDIDQQQQSKINQTKKKKKKCHGNQKLQHFKRKCRSRGMTEEQITELINTRNNNNNNNNNQIKPQHQNMKKKKKKKKKKQKQKKQSNKRKRSEGNTETDNTTVRSMSQLSVSQQQPLPKKFKTNSKEENNMASINHDLKASSKYLQMPNKLLLHSIRLQLNHPIKKKTEKSFILSRLKLLDQQFCIGMDQYLYQSYFADGSHHKIWPDDIIKITHFENYDQIENFVKEYLIQLQQKFDQFTTQLMTQALSCPKSMQLSLIESQLKEFIRLHHLDLTRKINFQINKFKDHIREKELFQQLSSYPLTNEQQQTIQRLCHLRQQQLERFEEMTKLEIRILCRILPKSMNELDQLILSNKLQHRLHNHLDVNNNNNNNNNNNSLYEAMKKHQKWIRDYKRQILAKDFENYESAIEQNEFLYQEELLNFEFQLSSSQNRQTDTNLMNCLYNYLNCQTMNKIHEIRFNETIVRYKLLHPCHRRSSLTTNNNTISIYPEAIVEIFEKVFTQQELDLLSSLGGPSYIRLNQSSVKKKEKIQTKIQDQHSTIMDKLASDLYHRHGLPTKASIIKKFSDQLEIIFNQQFSTSISYHDIHRTRKDLKLVLSIKRKLKKLPIIIRESDKSGILHIGYKSDYDKKVLLYQEKTNAYIELSSNPLMDTFYKVIHLLNELETKKQIKVWQHKKMRPDQKKIQLAYLYFIPKPHKAGTPLRPIVSSMYAPTTGISKMLDRLIRPLFDEHVDKTTFIDGVQFIRRLELYVQLGLLKPTTYLCTSDVTDLYTMLPQDEAIKILKKFLHHFNYTHVQGMTIDAIERLARLVLTENVFFYENKYYRQIKGGAMGSPFTLTLANIFMWDWEQQLVEHQRNSNELYGRYIDDIFFTSNDPIGKINEMLKTTTRHNPDIQLTSTIDHTNSFLDVHIKNIGNDFSTSVYHKEATEPYVVPFKSDHPRHVFVNIIECALLRAIRYSSTLDEFNRERRAIKLMLLYNGYPTRYIYSRFKSFFAKYHITSTSIIPMIHNENEFLCLRRQLLDQPTIHEHKRAARIAQQFDYNKSYLNLPPLVEAKLLKRRERANSIFLHYTHEKRFSHYKKTIHQLWNDTFHNTDVQSTKLLVGSRNNPNLGKEFVRRNPFPKQPKRNNKRPTTS